MTRQTIRTIVLCVLAIAIGVLIGLNVPLPSYDVITDRTEPLIVITPSPK